MTIATDVVSRKWQLLVGGELLDSSSDGREMETWNPGRGEVLAKVPLASTEDVDRAVEAAKAAFPGWWAAGPQVRASHIRQLAQLLRQNAEDLTWLDSANSGNPIRTSQAEIGGAPARVEQIITYMGEVRGQTLPGTRIENLHYTVKEPFGVVGVIIPFNHPTTFALNIVNAVAVGNTVVLKPSDQAPLSALLLAELCREAFPPGVINVVTGDGATTGAAIARHPDVRLIFFIGSVPTGQRILQLGAERGIKTSVLELGGKNPLIVCADADVPKAVRAAVQGMNFTLCAGQSCMSTSRVLIHSSIKKQFIESLAAEMEKIAVGDQLDSATQMGSLVTHAQQKRVLGFIEKAKQEGARLVVGGSAPESPPLNRGAFVPPTLFDGVKSSMTIAQEEVFGPVLSAIEWSGEDEAIDIANSVRYGLTAAIFTRDIAQAHRLAGRVQAGRVWVNSAIGGGAFGGHTPYSHYKDSGIGTVEAEAGGLGTFTQTKAIHVTMAE